MSRRALVSRAASVLALVGLVTLASGRQANAEVKQIKDVYPVLTSGVLAEARMTGLPTGVLLQAGGITVTQKNLDANIVKAPIAVRSQLQKNQVFVLENYATRVLIEAEAKTWSKQQGRTAVTDSAELIKVYLDSIAARASVTDAELKDFYYKNKEMMGGSSFDQVRDPMKDYVLNEKRQRIVDAHIRGIGNRMRIEVDEGWVNRQYKTSTNNPVDKARMSGKPLIVDFGADGCKPCDMMTPVLASLKKTYAGKANVLFVHVKKEQILAARYGISSIPVQVFFDKSGKEVFRHTGFFAKDQIVAKLAAIGVK